MDEIVAKIRAMMANPAPRDPRKMEELATTVKIMGGKVKEKYR